MCVHYGTHMRYLLAWLLLCGMTFAAEPPSPASSPGAVVQLSNDQPYVDKLAQVLADRPSAKDPKAHFHWLWAYFSACVNCRHYAEAETACRAVMTLAPQYALSHSNLSVVLGKQGKYQEALQEAEIAKLLDPSNSMHADAVACSWMYFLGQKQEAIDRFQLIPVPTDADEVRVYWGCRACFYSTVGTVDEIKSSIGNALQMDPENRAFFERDITFDRYRAEPWFVALVGQTLK